MADISVYTTVIGHSALSGTVFWVYSEGPLALIRSCVLQWSSAVPSRRQTLDLFLQALRQRGAVPCGTSPLVLAGVPTRRWQTSLSCLRLSRSGRAPFAEQCPSLGHTFARVVRDGYTYVLAARGLSESAMTSLASADYLEPDWQGSYWGAPNYQRLQAVKAEYDPSDAFTCHHCVQLPGSARD